MMYLALYRRLRPQQFSEVVGQEHIVRTLQNQLSKGRLSHAYLFCGTRGTGKTTMAKILAKAANCLEPQGTEPCNKCLSCREIDEARSLNVFEIDAASNNGVDNVRNIREEINYPPTVGDYKVYIIDEVHMLSGGAFNALLKTLEEPPPHVLFILATTDPQKIPATIHSRCQRFDFKRVGMSDMGGHIANYLDGEGLTIDPEGMELICQSSDGSVRDALSVLDQCISFNDVKHISLQMVQGVLGAVDRSVLFEMTDAIHNRDSASALSIISRIIRDGRDIGQFVSDMLGHFRDILVCGSLTDSGSSQENTLSYSAEHVEKLINQSKKIPGPLVMAYINEFSALSGTMRYVQSQRVVLEVACLKLCYDYLPKQSANDPEILMDRLARLEEKLASGDFVQESRSVQKKQTIKQKPEPEMRPKLKQAAPEDFKKFIDGWPDFVAKAGKGNFTWLTKTVLSYDDGALYINCENPVILSMLKSKEGMIREKMAQEFGAEVHFMMRVGEKAAKAAPGDGEEDPFDALKRTMGVDY